jgi:hypothetical protein
VLKHILFLATFFGTDKSVPFKTIPFRFSNAIALRAGQMPNVTPAFRH